MSTSHHRDRAAPGMLARLRERLHGRDNERGDALIEVMIWMGVIALLVTTYASASLHLNQVTRHSTAVDTVNQHGQAMLERAQVQPWATLGFNLDVQDAGPDGAAGPRDGKPAVFHDVAVSTDPDEIIQPHVVVNGVRKVKMTQNVFVTWKDRAAGTPAASAGTKIVTVVIDFEAPGSPGGSKTYTTERSSTPAEALPNSMQGVEAADHAAVGGGFNDVCPTPQVQMRLNGSYDVLIGEVASASGYHVYWDHSPHADKVRLSTSAVPAGHFDLAPAVATRIVEPGARLLVAPIVAGTELACQYETPTIAAPEVPQAPTAVQAHFNGGDIYWSPVPGAAWYQVMYRNGPTGFPQSHRWVEASATLRVPMPSPLPFGAQTQFAIEHYTADGTEGSRDGLTWVTP